LDLCRQFRRFLAQAVRLTFLGIISIAPAGGYILTPGLKGVVARASLEADLTREGRVLTYLIENGITFLVPLTLAYITQYHVGRPVVLFQGNVRVKWAKVNMYHTLYS
jgi:hypothetical protein